MLGHAQHEQEIDTVAMSADHHGCLAASCFRHHGLWLLWHAGLHRYQLASYCEADAAIIIPYILGNCELKFFQLDVNQAGAFRGLSCFLSLNLLWMVGSQNKLLRF